MRTMEQGEERTLYAEPSPEHLRKEPLPLLGAHVGDRNKRTIALERRHVQKIPLFIESGRLAQNAVVEEPRDDRVVHPFP